MGPRYAATSGPPSMPPLPPWLKKLLGALFGLYVFQLIASSLGVPVMRLAWMPLGQGFAPWQLLTYPLVQAPADLFGVLFGLLVLYFFLPQTRDSLGQRRTLEALAAAWLGSVVLGLAVDGALVALGSSLGRGPVLGWPGFVGICLVALFALSQPNATILAYFVVPVKAVYFLWGSLALTGLFILTSLAQGMAGSHSWSLLGAWCGTYAWWHLRGPGKRRNQLKRKGKKLERELERFRVIPGGRDDVH